MNKLLENMKLALHYFSITTVMVMIVGAGYITVFWGADVHIGVVFIWQLLLVSFLTSLCHLCFYTKDGRDLYGRQLAFRYVLAYAYVNVVVLGFGFLFKWFNPQSLPMVLGMVLVILIAFVVICSIAFWTDLKTADEINKKLMERNKEQTSAN